MDSDLRVSLWNVFRDFIPRQTNQYSVYISGNAEARTFYYSLWRDFFKEPIDSVPPVLTAALELVRRWWLDTQNAWDAIYDMVEFGLSILTAQQRAEYIVAMNAVLAREMSAYRILGDRLQPIIGDDEIGAVESAISQSPAPVESHLATALAHLPDRTNPDYRNSIKESISAVESAVRIFTGGDQTLGAGIAKLQKLQPIHPAFAQALSKLYGYSSDEGGIRHSLIEGSTAPTQAEAQFMLVACSAFINLLRASQT